jgi:hypothetical protein
MNFREITQNLHKAVVDFRLGSSEEEAVQKIIKDNVPLGEATAVSSKITSYEHANVHKPILDLDIPHYYGPSTTPGHAHLILDVELAWTDYVDLLTILAKCGILEEGYVNVALSRGQSWMRVPWIKKLSGDKNSSTDPGRFNPKTGWHETMIEGPAL